MHVPDIAALDESNSSCLVGFKGPPAMGDLVAPMSVVTEVLAASGAPLGPGPFTDEEVSLLETFADQAVIAIENARLFGELQDRTRELARSVEELQALGAVSQAVSSTLDLQQVLDTVLGHAMELAGHGWRLDLRVRLRHREFHDRATHGARTGCRRPLRRAPLRAGEGTARTSRRAAPAGAGRGHPGGGRIPGPDARALVQAGYRAMLAVPLLREDEIIGGLVVRRGTPGAVPPEKVALLQTFATQSALAIQNARLFNEIEEKSRQLEEASQHKSQFLANMSHELRTPLNAILGYTELILDEIYGDVPEKIAETLERVQTSGRHLLGLINDVLDLSKMEAGQLVLAPQEYALADVIQTVHTAVESLASEKGIGLRTEVEPDLPMGYGDDRRLVQVILNLVGNAIKFTDEGEVVIGCQLSAISDQPSAISSQSSAVSGQSQPSGIGRQPTAARQRSRFLVTVRDTGPGISAEQQGEDLRGVPASRHVEHARERRHGPGAEHRQADRRAAWRADLGGVGGRAGIDVRVRDPVRTDSES